MVYNVVTYDVITNFYELLSEPMFLYIFKFAVTCVIFDSSQSFLILSFNSEENLVLNLIFKLLFTSSDIYMYIKNLILKGNFSISTEYYGIEILRILRFIDSSW